MSMFRRDDILPDWEPAPWPMEASAANKQELGFHHRAQTPVKWQIIPWQSFPEGGILGHDKDWLTSVDAAFYTSTDEEDWLLIDNIWSGWPDPPRWGLVSRPSGDHNAQWECWGHFPDIPVAWIMPTAEPQASVSYRSPSFPQHIKPPKSRKL